MSHTSGAKMKCHHCVVKQSPGFLKSTETVQIISYLLVSVKGLQPQMSWETWWHFAKEELESKTVLLLGVYFIQRERNSGLFKCFQGLALHRMLIISDIVTEY